MAGKHMCPRSNCCQFRGLTRTTRHLRYYLGKSYMRFIVDAAGTAVVQPTSIATVTPVRVPNEIDVVRGRDSNERGRPAGPARLLHSGLRWDRSSRHQQTTTGVAGNNALVGINLNEGKEEIYRPTDG